MCTSVRWLTLGLAAAVLLIPQRTVAQAPRLALAPCSIPGVEGEVKCGVHSVFENRQAGAGRTIPLFVGVLPALESSARDPLFVLAGGPGQSASSLAGFANTAFGDVRRHRDIVLVDLAGTGRSAALQCSMYTTARDLVSDFYPIARVRACRDSLARRVDLRRYTTSTLMDDLDDVRAALGYATINIYGTSYGTRAALVYVRRHRAHVRAVVLKAVAPTTMRGTMDYARDTERSLGYLFGACTTDSACVRAFPNLSTEFGEVLARADRGALRGLVPDPAGGSPVELPLSRGVVASTLLGLLQNSNSAVRLPLLVHTTFLGDTRPFVEAIVAYRRALDKSIAFGMHLSVLCSEDAPRMEPARASVADRGTALGDYRVAQLAAACNEWVRENVPRGFADPVRSDVPALLVSGTLDPNTNERWGAEAARYLSRATHVVIPNLSHGFSSIAVCGASFIAAFIDNASADRVDMSCKDHVKLPPFVLPDR
ncbi:MAG: alpha/beta fold hydrolase [Gemmatimonadaceae bacterium]|nr:alpha/beta fold hydrolase [Gemmatimonadaceae bacterium]